jgi:hypothetical protein
MKKDKFKDFIQEHHDEFDMIEPSPELWKGIERSTKKKGSGFDSKSFLRIAASLFFILGAAWIALQIGNPIQEETAETETIQEEQSYDYAFSGLGDELAEVERFYVNEVSIKQSQLENYSVDEELLDEVELLNEEFEQLKIEMGQSADPMKVVEAMISNYQLRIEILQSILDEIEREREKTLQNGKDESYV